MSDTKNATPRPWKIQGDDSMMDIPFIEISAGDFGADFKRIAEVSCTLDENEEFRLTEIDFANAALIVRAVNAHDDLVAALEQIAIKAPHQVSREEAADMACEFKLVAEAALAKAKAGV